MATKKGFNPEWLKGKVFTGANEEEVVKDGRKHFVYTPFKRPLTEADVMNWNDKGDTVVIATNDGQKYTLRAGVPSGPEAVKKQAPGDEKK